MRDKCSESRATAEPSRPELPLPRDLAPAERWRRRALLATVLVAQVAAIRFDVRIKAFLQSWLGACPFGVRDALREFGEVPVIALLTVVAAVFDRRRIVLVLGMTLACVLAGGAESLGKAVIVRYRPRSAVGASVGPDDWRALWGGLTWELGPTEQQAFPSGHTALAFAFAGVMAWFYPRLRWVFYVLAVGCGLSRVLDGMHWVGDCIAGGAIGLTAAWLALRPYAWVRPVVWWHRWRRAHARARAGARV
jgi:membrane-associated phospholipid phosphatase